MAKKQKNKSKNQDTITIANIIALVGLVLLLVFTFIGHSYMSGGELGWDILIAVVVTAVAGGLLWFMIKCKGAPNQLDKWKKIEIATLVCYIVLAIPASLFGGIMHFFVVNDHKDQIKGYAQQDIAQIDSLFSSYRTFEEEAIGKTKDGLTSAIGRPDVDPEVRNIIKTREDMNSYVNTRKDRLLGVAYRAYEDSVKTMMNEFRGIVDNWSIIQIPFKAYNIEKTAEAVGSRLTNRSSEVKLPRIINGRIGENQKKEFKIDPTSLKFRKALQDARGFSWTALIVVLLIHLLILFNYFVARRTDVLQAGETKREEDGGTLL